MNRLKSIVLISLIFSCFVVKASDNVYTIETVPKDHIRDASDYVSNPDQIISFEAERHLNQLIALVEDSTTAEIAVVLLNSIGSDDINDFATRLFTFWGIGKDKKDSGLLFILVLDQKQMVFRTGYGLEGVIPDIIASRIIRNDIVPLLKQGNYDAGIIAGISRSCDYLTKPEAAKEIIQQENAARSKKTYSVLYFYLAVSFIIFLVFLFTTLSKLRSEKTNYKKYLDLDTWKIGTVACAILFPALMAVFAIIFFLILKRLRNKPIVCLGCGNPMHKLKESEEDIFLSPAQQTEECIQSIDYDVWQCGNCQRKEILPYTKTSRYKECPGCHAKTFCLTDDSVVRRATTLSSGLGEQVFSCKNCGKEDIIRYTIPIIILSSGGRGGRGGGFSGGGGSWGGGSTGGGGASGGW